MIGAFKSFLKSRFIQFSTKVKYIKNDNNIARLKRAGLLTVGEHTYGKFLVDSYEGSETKLTIGKYCSISKDVKFIVGGIHPVDWVALYPFRIKWHMEGALVDGMPASKGPIVVGNDVWIGTDAKILSGLTIGDGAIIMAGSIVTRDVQAYTIVGGIPAKEIKKRFSDEVIDGLQKIKWWDWDEEKIKTNINYLSSNNLDEFIEKHK